MARRGCCFATRVTPLKKLSRAGSCRQVSRSLVPRRYADALYPLLRQRPASRVGGLLVVSSRASLVADGPEIASLALPAGWLRWKRSGARRQCQLARRRRKMAVRLAQECLVRDDPGDRTLQVMELDRNRIGLLALRESHGVRAQLQVRTQRGLLLGTSGLVVDDCRNPVEPGVDAVEPAGGIGVIKADRHRLLNLVDGGVGPAG